MIHFYNNTSYKILKKSTLLKQFIQFKIIQKKYSLQYLNIILCNDDYLIEINKKYLKHNFYTDIITFNLSEKPKNIEGELYISLDMIIENASKYNTIQKEELWRIIFHGVLHLLGNNDKLTTEKEKMTKLENTWLKEFKIFMNE